MRRDLTLRSTQRTVVTIKSLAQSQSDKSLETRYKSYTPGQAEVLHGGIPCGTQPPYLQLDCMSSITSVPADCQCRCASAVADASAAGRLADAIAITGYTIFINIAVTGEGSQVWNILHGPLSIVFGMLAGLAAALICSPTKLWNNVYKRTSVVFILCAHRAPISGAWQLLLSTSHAWSAYGLHLHATAQRSCKLLSCHWRES